MPHISKQALSQFLLTGCERQLRLNLSPDNSTYQAERRDQGMPDPQPPRPGLAVIRDAGVAWQEEKLHDLTQTFGANSIIGNRSTNRANHVIYNPIDLGIALAAAAPMQFLVEAEYAIGVAFQAALGITAQYRQLQINFGTVRPDIIEVLDPLTYPRGLQPDGTAYLLSQTDSRMQLRIIDIKLTAKASQGYFAEVTYYSMALAAWILDHGLDNQFVVVPDAAIWPGSHDSSSLVQIHREYNSRNLQASLSVLREAMQEDLEVTPYEVFSLRVRRFLRVDVPSVLGSPWRVLEWHVDSRCANCEYLGEPRPGYVANLDHCMPLAANCDHLSRVAFVSQGARLSLQQAGVPQVATLAQLSSNNPVFDTHQTLKSTRTVVAGRAQSLQSNQTIIPNQSGTSACMPRWADLHVYISVDFDLGSAITVAFGLKAFWYEPRPQNSPLTNQRRSRVWPSRGQVSAQIVDQRDLAVERRELLAFLQQIHDILEWCRQQDSQTLALPELAGLSVPRSKDYRTRIQFYVWDSLQYEHLMRVFGRHLSSILSNQNISYLAWLFPPEDLMPNPDLATQRSPITIVREVVRGLLAAPIPHHYGLVDVARVYHSASLPPNVAAFSIHPLFDVPLSDQIPSERAHEIWARITTPSQHWQHQMATYQETVRKRLAALETVTQRLETDLRNQLTSAAPLINIGPPIRQSRLSVDGQLWYAFSKLNAVLAELDVHQIRAMPPHERTAKFRSARLRRRLNGAAEIAALAQLGLPVRVGRRVYEMSPDSSEVKAKVDDFSFAFSPESQPGFLDRKLAALALNTSLANQYGADWSYLEEATNITIAGLDRSLGLIAVDTNVRRYPTLMDDLTNVGLADFDNDVIMDPVYQDFFTSKLLATLSAIGNPPLAANRPLVQIAQAAIGQRPLPARPRDASPAADFLWNGAAMGASTLVRNLSPVRAALIAHGLALNATQWQAWEDALTHRARLVWGPPGTGKSRTVRAIVVGAILEAVNAQRTLRVLVCASTYTAIDNVLLPIASDLSTLLQGSVDTFRVRSMYQSSPGNASSAIGLELSKGNPSIAVRNLRAILQNGNSSVVVGATPEQVHNLLTCDNGSARDEWFDLIVIDEASQMDVSHAVLPIAGVADQGSVVLAGDPMQLPPIHQAEAPAGLEDMVGSVYRFFERHHGVGVSTLGVNYRSNDTLVEFGRQSGYQSSLASHSPNLRVDFLTPLPTSQPHEWPPQLHWNREWTSLLDANQPAVCFVYDDRQSSQRNFFEAHAVAAMIQLLNGRLSEQLCNENSATNGLLLANRTTPYSVQGFWQEAIGVVTPHRAQQGLIISQLQAIFGSNPQTSEWIRGAVDTVERFQGQQRDVIIASYALGDPDQIADEEEFLMSLNRFNVMASRARAKLIVLVSRQVVDHLAKEVEVLRDSRLLKIFAESYCNQGRPMTVGYTNNGTVHQVHGELRWRQ
jgi:DNA replication ATP-dependent helicase Dna2